MVALANGQRSLDVIVATLVYEPPPIYFEFADRINRHYCERHGYRYEVFRPDPQLERSPLWSTIGGVRRLLPEADVVLYIDADAYTWDPTRPVETLMKEQMGEAGFMAGTDRRSRTHGWSDTNANLGVFIVRRSDEMLQFFDDWWQVPARFDPRWRWRWPLHQGAFNFVMRPLARDGLVRIIPYHYLNGIDGTFIRHLALQSDEYRRELLQRECERLIDGRQGWI